MRRKLRRRYLEYYIYRNRGIDLVEVEHDLRVENLIKVILRVKAK